MTKASTVRKNWRGRRVLTNEELEVARAIYKAELLRLTLAGKHILKRDKARLIIKAFDEAIHE